MQAKGQKWAVSGGGEERDELERGQGVSTHQTKAQKAIKPACRGIAGGCSMGRMERI